MKNKDKKIKAEQMRNGKTEKELDAKTCKVLPTTKNLGLPQNIDSKQGEITKNNTKHNSLSNHSHGGALDSSNGEIPFTSPLSPGRNSPSASLSKTYGGSDLVTQNEHLASPITKQSEKVPKSPNERLVDLLNCTKYTHVQRNGQRIYGGPPPNWQGGYPAKGSEIFVGKVPRDIFEDELVPIFETVGKIYELRLMMDFSGCNRGYFFVCYTTPKEAKRAVKELNNFEIRPGKLLGVIASVDNRKLWISGIPKNRTPAEIKVDMEKLTEGVQDIILYPSQTDKSKTRGYAFVEYESHRAAALARRKLVPGRIYICGQEIEKVDWAEPENEVDEETMSKVKILFLRNLMGTTSETQIRSTFEKLSPGQVERVKKAKDYAFVHFTSRDAAEKALTGINLNYGQYLLLDGAEVEVTWSKPVDKHIYNQRKQLTKALTAQPFPYANYGGPVAMANSSLYMGPMEAAFMSQNINSTGGSFVNDTNDTRINFRGVLPRKRGAAGVRGLGAPGTAPPRGLVRKLVNDSNALGSGPFPSTLVPQIMNGHLSNGSDENLGITPTNATNAHFQHQIMPNAHAMYAEQFLQTLQDLKLAGGVGGYWPSGGDIVEPLIQTSISSNDTTSLSNKLSTSSVIQDRAKAVVSSNQNMVNANASYCPVNVALPFPSIPGGYVWPDIYHFNPMAVAAASACVASAYGAQFIPNVCARYPTTPGVGQTQVTAVTQQTTQNQLPIVSNRQQPTISSSSNSQTSSTK